jgi:surface protein
MDEMFEDATNFNQNLSTWNTSKVTNLAYMFAGTNLSGRGTLSPGNGHDFNNGGVGGATGTLPWDTSNVTNMAFMFDNNWAFNQNIGTWNTNKVANMSAMFRDTDSFDHNISTWNVSVLTNVTNMFVSAFAFNQNLSPWITAVVSQPSDFSGGASSNPTFDNNANNLKPFLSDGVTRINT